MLIVALNFGSRQGNIYLAYKIDSKYSEHSNQKLLVGQSRQATRQDSAFDHAEF